MAVSGRAWDCTPPMHSGGQPSVPCTHVHGTQAHSTQAHSTHTHGIAISPSTSTSGPPGQFPATSGLRNHTLTLSFQVSPDSSRQHWHQLRVDRACCSLIWGWPWREATQGLHPSKQRLGRPHWLCPVPGQEDRARPLQGMWLTVCRMVQDLEAVRLEG